MTSPGAYAQAAGFGDPAKALPHAAQLQAMLDWLAETQWWSGDRIGEYQLLELARLLRHARNSVPFYRQRLGAARARSGAGLTAAGLRALPLLTRRNVQNAGAALVSKALPAQFAPVSEKQTSGSTGEPVKVRASALDNFSWEAMTMRDHEWHQREFGGKLASIRVFAGNVAAPPHGAAQVAWGPPVSHIHATGPGVFLSLDADIDTQARWLLREAPDYLITYPTNLMALIRRFTEMGERLRGLKQVRTVGETVTQEIRDACRDFFETGLADVYSSQEIGTIALQCPEGGQYHVMAEDLLVEILDADGAPCKPGEVGRVVVTTLHNYATPLIRYELGDYAEAGTACPCGRGLPTLARILGRSRNLVTLPGGKQHWPQVGYAHFRDIAPIRQFQLVQHDAEQIEIRLVADRMLLADEIAQLTEVINTALGYEFRLNFNFFEREIPRGPGGKFEEFSSRLEGKGPAK